MRKSTSLIALVLALATLISGCGPSNSDESGGGTGLEEASGSD